MKMNTLSLNNFTNKLNKLLSNDSIEYFETYKMELCSGGHIFHRHINRTNDKSFIMVSAEVKENETESTFLLGNNFDNINDTLCNETNALDITGSPLKLHDYQKDVYIPKIDISGLNLVHPNYPKPVSGREASKLVSLFTSYCHLKSSEDGLKTDFPLFVVLCDGITDAWGLVNTACFVNLEEENENFVRNEDEREINSYIQIFSLYMKDFMTDKQVITPVQSFIPNHVIINNKFLKFESTYMLYGMLNESTNCILLNFQWNGNYNILDQPPMDASALLSIDIEDMKLTNQIEFIYKDLNILQKLSETIKSGFLDWKTPASTEGFSMMDRVQKLINDTKATKFTKLEPILLSVNVSSNGVSGSNRERLDTAKLAPRMEYFNFAERSDIQFTDHMWDILKETSSYSDLVLCLKYLLTEVDRKTVQPLVNPRSQTILSNIIRKSFRDSIVIDISMLLKEENPLLMLAEIGFEKLIKDFSSIFFGKEKLTSPSNFSHYLSFDPNEKMDTRIVKLRKLFQVLQINVFMSDKIQVTKQTLGYVLSATLKHFENGSSNSSSTSNSSSFESKFKIEIPMLTASSYIKNSTPYIWECSYIGDYEKEAEDIEGTLVLTNVSHIVRETIHHSDFTISDDTNCYKLLIALGIKHPI